MRGRRDPQATMLAFVDMEERVPKDHPLRTIKPGFPILGVFRLRGRLKRDRGIITRFCKPVNLGCTTGFSSRRRPSSRDPLFFSVFIVIESPNNGIMAL